MSAGPALPWICLEAAVVSSFRTSFLPSPSHLHSFVFRPDLVVILIPLQSFGYPRF